MAHMLSFERGHLAEYLRNLDVAGHEQNAGHAYYYGALPPLGLLSATYLVMG